MPRDSRSASNSILTIPGAHHHYRNPGSPLGTLVGTPAGRTVENPLGRLVGRVVAVLNFWKDEDKDAGTEGRAPFGGLGRTALSCKPLATTVAPVL